MDDWILKALNGFVLIDEINQRATARLEIDAWVASSMMHKAIRRGEVEVAQSAALCFHRLRGNAIWRRLMVIAFEEVSDDLVTHMRFTHKVQAASEFTGSVAPAAAPTAQQPLNVVAAVQQPAKPAIDPNIKKVQVALAGLGYDINKLDGLLNDETHSAILKYQMDNGLDMGGTVDSGLLEALKISGK